ncbi:MAG: hypothetical protein R3A79_13445 [Nannocystaceae bacterium]
MIVDARRAPLLPGLLAAALLFPACSPESATSDTAGEEAYILGERASDACASVSDRWPALTAATDLTAASAAYEGALQDYIRDSDAITGRSDDAAITAALAGDEVAAIQPMIEVALIARIRAEIVGPEQLVEDPYAAWDEAYCLWSGPIKDLAAAAEFAGDPRWDSDIVQTVDIAFIEGHKAIDGEPPAAHIDDWVVPPAKQQIEKTLFRALHRLVLAEAAAGVDDPAAARRALERFQGLEDRLEGRNTPGIAVVEAMLADPATYDRDELRRQIAVAFAKRTRKYCDEAVETGELGVPTGYKGAVEGRTYQALITPDMAAQLGADFDAGAYVTAWDDYLAAVKDGDAEAAATLSVGLVEWNCAYQAALGIGACTASDDEPEA